MATTNAKTVAWLRAQLDHFPDDVIIGIGGEVGEEGVLYEIGSVYALRPNKDRSGTQRVRYAKGGEPQVEDRVVISPGAEPRA